MRSELSRLLFIVQMLAVFWGCPGGESVLGGAAPSRLCKR